MSSKNMFHSSFAYTFKIILCISKWTAYSTTSFWIKRVYSQMYCNFIGTGGNEKSLISLKRAMLPMHIIIWTVQFVVFSGRMWLYFMPQRTLHKKSQFDLPISSDSYSKCLKIHFESRFNTSRTPITFLWIKLCLFKKMIIWKVT